MRSAPSRCQHPAVPAHHNINCKNILLGQEFNAKIASFGAAEMNIAGHNQPLPITDLPLGNFGYAAPDYGVATSQLMEKVDIYSFGVVLLELVTGKAANGVGADGLLAIWDRDNCNELMANHLKMFKIDVDKGIPDQARYMEDMATVFRLGVDCTVGDPKQRPSMQMALKRLRRSRGRGPFHGLLILYITRRRRRQAFLLSITNQVTEALEWSHALHLQGASCYTQESGSINHAAAPSSYRNNSTSISLIPDTEREEFPCCSFLKLHCLGIA